MHANARQRGVHAEGQPVTVSDKVISAASPLPYFQSGIAVGILYVGRVPQCFSRRVALATRAFPFLKLNSQIGSLQSGWIKQYQIGNRSIGDKLQAVRGVRKLSGFHFGNLQSWITSCANESKIPASQGSAYACVWVRRPMVEPSGLPDGETARVSSQTVP